MLGGAAALFLQATDLRGADDRRAASADAGLLGLEVSGERSALEAAAYDALEGALAAGVPQADGSFAALSSSLESALAQRLARAYPRTTSAGHTISVELAFARVAPVEAEAEVASPFGGRSPLPLPVFLAAEGAAQVTAEGPRGNFTALVAFAARDPRPLLLPGAIAARFALEALAGGRVERLASQAAQRAAGSGGLDKGQAEEAVRFAVEAELALEFGSSGNATLDGRLRALRGTAGQFSVKDFVNGSAGLSESVSLDSFGDGVTIAGQPRTTTLHLRDVNTSGVAVSADWTLFDAQELAPALWGGLRLAAGGLVQFSVDVEGPGGSARVGPITVPVAFEGRAFTEDYPRRSPVNASALNDALTDVDLNGTASRFAPALMRAGILFDRNGSFPHDNATRAVVEEELARAIDGAGLPPAESMLAFERTFWPPVAFFDPGFLLLDAPVPLEGARAVLTVDGSTALSAPVAGTQVALDRFPRGFHAIALTVEANGSTYAGRGDLTVDGPGWTASLALSPVVPSAFLTAALARHAAVPARAGFAILDEAAAMAGLTRPSNLTTAAQATEFAEGVLRRLEAVSLSGLADKEERARARDAQGFLKIAVRLLEAADAAYESATAKKMPVGGVLGGAAQVAITGDPTKVITVAIGAVTLARAAVGERGIELTFFRGGAPAKALAFRFDELLLVGAALGGAATLAADSVKVTHAFDAGSGADDADRALAVAGTAADFAKISVAIAKGVYKIAGEAALKAVAPQLARLSIAVSAAFVILDIAALYHETGGNLSAMWEELVHPSTIGDLTRLPGIIGGATAVLYDILYFTGALASKGGLIGLAVGLFVLAALLVANKEKAASAIWGTLPYEALGEVRAQVADALTIAFAGSAAGNALNLSRLDQARRTAAASAASAWLRAFQGADAALAATASRAAETWRAYAHALTVLRDGAARLRFASVALAEELDDFASAPYVDDEGRMTEGYAFHHDLRGDYPYRGNVEVVEHAAGHNLTLSRREWRERLGAILPADLSAYGFGFDLTETNAIPQSEFQRWSSKVSAASGAFRDAYGAVLTAQFELAGLDG